MSNHKKIKTYLEATDLKEEGSTISEIETQIKAVSKNKTITKEKIKKCLKAIELYISEKVSSQYDKFLNDFNAVDKVIHRCFSVSLNLNSSSSSQSISYFDLFEIIRLIDTKDLLP